MTSVMASNANPPAVVMLDTTASTIPIRHLTPLSGSSNSDWGGRFNQPLAHRPDVSSLRVPATHHAGRPARGARPRGGGIVGGRRPSGDGRHHFASWTASLAAALT